MEKLTFDQAIEELETILDDLEKNSENYSEEQISQKLDRAEALKDHCKNMLKNEKSDIIKTAKENNISLEELGIDEGEDDFEDDEEDEEEDEDEEEK